MGFPNDLDGYVRATPKLSAPALSVEDRFFRLAGEYALRAAPFVKHGKTSKHEATHVRMMLLGKPCAVRRESIAKIQASAKRRASVRADLSHGWRSRASEYEIAAFERAYGTV